MGNAVEWKNLLVRRGSEAGKIASRDQCASCSERRKANNQIWRLTRFAVAWGLRGGLQWIYARLGASSPVHKSVPLPTLDGHLKWLDALAWFQATMERLKAKNLDNFLAHIHKGCDLQIRM